MRLFLSSFRLGTDVPELVALAGRAARVAITTNAVDNLASFPRDALMEQERKSLAQAGLDCSELDLRDYYTVPETLRETVAEVDLVWATGGNSFVLRDALKRSGLDALLLERVGDDSMAYGGYSAGACVCGPTLRGLELVDDVGAVPKPVWAGLGLVEFSLVPHYRSDHPESKDVERVVESISARTRCRFGCYVTGRPSSSETARCVWSRCSPHLTSMMEADGSTSNKLPQPPALSDQVLQRRRTSSAATDAEEAMLAHMADLNHVESR